MNSASPPPAAPPKATRTGVLEHLQRLPDVFDLGLFCLQTGIAPASAKVMLSRWAHKGLVAHAGPKAGIYFKRLGQHLDDSEQVAAAVLALFPSAVVMGPSILHAQGWTTQVPRNLHVATINEGRSTQLHGVIQTRRSLEWLKTLHAHQAFEPPPATRGGRPATAWEALRKLKPAWALADLLAHNGGWHPDPDDLDIPPESLEEWRRACRALERGVDLPKNGCFQ